MSAISTFRLARHAPMLAEHYVDCRRVESSHGPADWIVAHDAHHVLLSTDGAPPIRLTPNEAGYLGALLMVRAKTVADG